MKYSEFFEQYWDGRGKEKQRKLLFEQSVAFRAAWLAFEVLSNRRGFDGWWGDIDEDTQDECFAAIVKKIAPAI